MAASIAPTLQPLLPVTHCAAVRRRGVAVLPLAVTVLAGAAIYLLPRPAGLTADAWRLLAIFLSTILAVILQPLPLGAVSLLGLSAAIVTNTLTFSAAFAAFVDDVPWLVALAFFIARGLVNTGLGERVACNFVRFFGGTTLGLGYSVVLAEVVLAPVIPSVSARGGGVILPLVRSLAEACGSRVGDGTERRMGAWLAVTCFQTMCISSSMFLTAMAANPLAAKLAFQATGRNIGWVDWAKAAAVPGAVSLAVVPAVLYAVYPPATKRSTEAPKLAKEKLELMGPMSTDEIVMAATMATTVGLWIFGGALGVAAVTAALLGVSALLVTGVVTWNECLAEAAAWDALTWFSALIAMAGHLNDYGVVSWFTDSVVEFVGGLELPWQLSFGVLALVYFYSHYFFASGVAHVGAMYTAFVSVATALGAPPYLAAVVLALLVDLMGGLTHYSIGSAPAFYGAGYVPLAHWWGLGLAVSVVNVTIWAVVGGVWWKIIGLW